MIFDLLFKKVGFPLFPPPPQFIKTERIVFVLVHCAAQLLFLVTLAQGVDGPV